MNDITQGTIISGIRSEKYPEIECKAIVISARCDIANCKIKKFYYLTAITLSEWIFSREGVGKWLIPKLRSQLDSFLKSNGLDYETLLSFSEEENQFIFHDKSNFQPKEDEHKKEAALSKLLFIIKSKSLAVIPKDSLDAIDEKKKWREWLVEYIKGLSVGNNMQLTFIPPKDEKIDICEGLIIDNAEIDYFDEKTLQIIIENKMDEKSLSDAEKKSYNKTFYIEDGSGFSINEGTLPSPWIEYVLQRFSNCFTRIGVYTPSDNQISEFI